MDFPILPPWTPDFEASAWKPWNLQPIALLQHVAYPNSEAKVQTLAEKLGENPHSVHCLIIFTYYLTVEELVPPVLGSSINRPCRRTALAHFHVVRWFMYSTMVTGPLKQPKTS